MDELWQLFDEQGNALVGEGATKNEVFDKGLLHGASHVWIWRQNDNTTEVLVQKRAASKRTWPNKFDISAAGHIDVGEDPTTAALREVQEEIGLKVNVESLQGVTRAKIYMTAENGEIENEFQWLYLLKLPTDSEFTLQNAGVDSLAWKTLDDFEAECGSDLYLPHGVEYYNKVIAAIKTASRSS